MQNQLRSEEKKTGHFLHFTSPQISILALKVNYMSQNEMFRQLIWGIVRLCRSNMTRDMRKKWKVDFSKNVNFHTFFFQIFASKFLSVFSIFQDYNFHLTSTISISYESCDVNRSFDTLVRSLRLLVWPQRPHKVTDGKVTENQECKNSQFWKINFSVFYHISDHIWPTEAYNTSN